MVVLHHLHTLSMIHRNVSPSCIKFRKDGSACVSGFHVAANLQDGSVDYTTLVGNIEFVAPEIVLCSAISDDAASSSAASNLSYSYAVDVWALGVLVFNALTGDLPFGGRVVQADSEMEADDMLFRDILHSDPSPPASMDVDARDFILQCLAKRPDERPTVRDLLLHPFVTKHLNWQRRDEELTPDAFHSPQLEAVNPKVLTSGITISCACAQLDHQNPHKLSS